VPPTAVTAETGGVATDMKGKPLDALICNLETRTSLLCAPSAQLHAAALTAVNETK